jgi:hyperosmotically inducible protein
MKRTTSLHKTASRLTGGVALLAVLITAVPVFADAPASAPGSTVTTAKAPDLALAERVRKQLVTLPTYGVFDDLGFRIDGSTVTLNGYASRPILKSAAERTVKSIEGVKSVINKIEVLPLSQMDDNIRLKTYLAIYRNPNLQRYSVGSGFIPRLTPLWAAGGITNNPPTGWNPIHIIVKNGNVTLTGVVGREADKTIAGMAANRVSGVFAVNNSLIVASDSNRPQNTVKADS